MSYTSLDHGNWIPEVVGWSIGMILAVIIILTGSLYFLSKYGHDKGTVRLFLIVFVIFWTAIFAISLTLTLVLTDKDQLFFGMIALTSLSVTMLFVPFLYGVIFLIYKFYLLLNFRSQTIWTDMNSSDFDSTSTDNFQSHHSPSLPRLPTYEEVFQSKGDEFDSWRSSNSQTLHL